ncbi:MULTISPECIES: hypothetical protein [unclassified Hyphomicrobium]|jgi:hypothetical protein|uniref:hypothetical protein n=1 Tax=unclassified Hyphomicrobium TaxID=2619925 RepID=UPI000213E8DA|nr:MULTISPECIES: hypothetical protein [unclassified Hyphomicrobium]CCB65357.1 conserved exported protein of unknown function [Hyphomicrobium sp. MC1]
MRRSAFALILVAVFAGDAAAQVPPTAPAKPNANPCRDEVSAALQKLRKSSWFRMDTQMITENGPTSMQVDYVLPDRMRQTVTDKLTNKTTQLILVGDHAWADQGSGWRPVPQQIAAQLREQMDDTVVRQQTDVGDYSCKGRAQIDGRDVLSYKLESEPEKGSSSPQNQAFRMFYVDALTGLPASNALLAPGHEDKPIFKTTYSFPIDMKIEPPKDALPDKAPEPATPAPAEGK